MSRLRYNRAEAVAHLCDRCDRLGAFIQDHGRFTMPTGNDPDLFISLARSIVYQQLSGKAAGTIYGRFETLFDQNTPNAAQVPKLSFEDLRGVGLSRNKALSIQDLAEKTLAGVLASRRKIGRMDDQAVIDNLVQVRGIGPWTVQMLLLFHLGRPDVMPSTDLGVQKGVQRIYNMRKLPTPQQVEKKTKHLAPYRSVASWYFWRAADTVLMT